MKTAVWVEAFNRWYAQASVAFYNIVPDNKNSIRAFRLNANLRVCDFCLGPCGDCPGKGSGNPYACDDCEQEMFGYNECTYCPYRDMNHPN